MFKICLTKKNKKLHFFVTEVVFRLFIANTVIGRSLLAKTFICDIFGLFKSFKPLCLFLQSSFGKDENWEIVSFSKKYWKLAAVEQKEIYVFLRSKNWIFGENERKKFFEVGNFKLWYMLGFESLAQILKKWPNAKIFFLEKFQKPS